MFIPPLLLVAEFALGYLYMMHESQYLPIAVFVFFVLLMLQPRLQCSRMAIYVSMISAATLSWTAWGTRLFMIMYKEGAPMYGVCIIKTGYINKIQDLMNNSAIISNLQGGGRRELGLFDNIVKSITSAPGQVADTLEGIQGWQEVQECKETETELYK